ncbi:uncharacterized protein PgNI_02872 [Pyricularia grisea]|uniref:Fe2OG dioxygenase domain-containing protein n=1 Tax=Pyricularia grisea TaxID=148305 RepID=A0A6P8BEQ2_PYRGI|nr:uncharacterized protein PgNI_02872 [Pyricularia grisea]TLD14172.1 hypothetical protein PgNI_02872 [Pyricularia grisea]
MFQFDPSLIPSLRTRKALLIIDLQNDFASPTGALPVTEPEGYIGRILEVAAAFRASGDGDVIWVRSEYDAPRPIENDNILTSDALLVSSMRSSTSRLRRLSVDKSDQDDEAFLSGGAGSSKPECVRPGTSGAELVAEAAIDSKRDSNLVKTEYSAFASGQLLPLLRTRLATELYVCGALTNVSIHATALDAASHGFAMTLVDDCCGYRSAVRHANAVRNLMQLTGCETTTAHDMLVRLGSSGAEQQQQQQQQQRPRQPPGPVRTGTRATGDAGRPGYPGSKLVGSSSGAQGEMSDGSSPQPSLSQTDPSIIITSTNTLPQAMSKLKLSNDPSSRPAVAEPDAPRPETTQPALQALVSGEVGAGLGKQIATATAEPITDAHASSESSGTGHERDSGMPAEAGFKKSGSPPQKTDESTKPPEAPSTLGAVSDDNPLEPLCEGDTTIIPDLLPGALEQGIFDKLRAEVSWLRMSHQGGEVPRLVCVQGAVSTSDASVPLYRHPADEAPPLVPFSPTVLKIKEHVERHIGHELNHVLVQLYRSGQDYISEHSDKTLDVVRGSYIANVSLGAERKMVFRTKRGDKSKTDEEDKEGEGSGKKREIVKANLPHNSLVKMGLRTNARWTHAIKQDRRADRDRLAPELAFGGARISLTFRQIGTFLDKDGLLIWGQGATGKTRADAKPVKNGASEEAERMIRAFGVENNTPDFDWDAVYGEGFDVLHFKTVPRLWVSGDETRDLRIKLMLGSYGVGFAIGGDDDPKKTVDGETTSAKELRFVDNDVDKSDVRGDFAVMLYLESTYGKLSAGKTGSLAKRLTRFEQAMSLLDKWRATAGEDIGLNPLKGELTVFEDYMSSGGEYVAGGEAPSLADFALWPVLRDMAGFVGASGQGGKEKEKGKGDETFSGLLEEMGLSRLGKYYESFGLEKFVGRVVEE